MLLCQLVDHGWTEDARHRADSFVDRYDHGCQISEFPDRQGTHGRRLGSDERARQKDHRQRHPQEWLEQNNHAETAHSAEVTNAQQETIANADPDQSKLPPVARTKTTVEGRHRFQGSSPGSAGVPSATASTSSPHRNKRDACAPRGTFPTWIGNLMRGCEPYHMAAIAAENSRPHSVHFFHPLRLHYCSDIHRTSVGCQSEHGRTRRNCRSTGFRQGGASTFRFEYQ